MELKSILLPEKVVTFEYPGLDGLEFDLAFLSKDSNQDILKKCTITRFNPKFQRTDEELDDEKFLEMYVAAIVKNWRGFKMKYLSEFVIADFSDFDDDQELDYSQENALTLMKSSTTFDNWVSKQIGEIKNFTKQDSKKKSIKSKDTSKSPAKE